MRKIILVYIAHHFAIRLEKHPEGENWRVILKMDDTGYFF